MAYESYSLNRRAVGPTVTSAVIGIAAGVVAVIGVANFTGANDSPQPTSLTSEQALLGGPEYGTRN